MKNNLKLGVLGGMGPYATIIFMKLILDYTNASTDQDNINMVITNDTLIPDRTSYILNNKLISPLEYLKKDIKILENSNCNVIAITCNTAHYWYEELQNYSKIPITNMVLIISNIINKNNYKKVGILATTGTIKTKIFTQYLKTDIIFIPPDAIQKIIDNLIYEKVKKNKKVNKREINYIIKYFQENKCDRVIFGCTELSVIKYELRLNDSYIIDTLEELAKYIVINYKNKLIE